MKPTITIVAYWTPDQLPEPGKEMNFKYTITFSRDEDKLHAPDNAWVQQTRRSTGDVEAVEPDSPA